MGLGGNGANVPVARRVAHEAPGVLHLAVSVQVVDVSGRWLLQRRAPTKMLFANRWANTCCTHPAPGQDPARAALQRLREETGLVVEDLLPAGSFTYRATDPHSHLVENEHDFVFAAVADVRTAEPDPEEISELALLPFEDAVDLLQSAAAAPWSATVLRHCQAALGGDALRGPAAGGAVVGGGVDMVGPPTGPSRKEGQRP
ncbi:MAG: NUDIX domain-containing protein [Actinobacteria bacterium]|nr:NUDIX domain-containing protein [Actinomycetota bacterium]